MGNTYNFYNPKKDVAAVEQAHFLSEFPPSVDLNTVPVLLAIPKALAPLAELKGLAAGLPDPKILLNTLFLQEALASSKIENIVTTQDELFQVDLDSNIGSVEAKEVARYRGALELGYKRWQESGHISESTLIEMFQLLKQRTDKYRKIPGTVLRNAATGETVYKPPQNEQDIIQYMRRLEAAINDTPPWDLDPLIKMALIHHQFESIHPFHDGNGRIGRILNVLYLTHTGLLDAPILYLSRSINRTKSEYYRLLQAVRLEKQWEEWVIYMLKMVEEAALSTLHLVREIRDLMAECKRRMREELPKIYSQDLLNNLFRHPYARIEYVAKDLNVGKRAATRYLKKLTEYGFVVEIKARRNNYYVNEALVDLLLSVSGDEA